MTRFDNYKSTIVLCQNFRKTFILCENGNENATTDDVIEKTE